MSRTAKGTGPRTRTQTDIATPADTPAGLAERARVRLGIWWWPAMWAAGTIVAITAIVATGGARPFLYGPAAALGVSASAAARHRLVAGLGAATSWAAIGLVWAAVFAALSLAAPGLCVDPTSGANVACTPRDVAIWATLGPLITVAILIARVAVSVAAKSSKLGVRAGAATVRAGRGELSSPWVRRTIEMIGGAFVAGAAAAAAGGHGGIIVTAAAAGAAVSPLVSPLRFSKGGRK